MKNTHTHTQKIYYFKNLKMGWTKVLAPSTLYLVAQPSTFRQNNWSTTSTNQSLSFLQCSAGILDSSLTKCCRSLRSEGCFLLTAALRSPHRRFMGFRSGSLLATFQVSRAFSPTIFWCCLKCVFVIVLLEDSCPLKETQPPHTRLQYLLVFVGSLQTS